MGKKRRGGPTSTQSSDPSQFSMQAKFFLFLGLTASVFGTGIFNTLNQGQQTLSAFLSQQQPEAEWRAPDLHARRFFHPQSGDVQFLLQGQVSLGLPSPQFGRSLEVQPQYILGHKVVNEFPHDRDAFTQGLFIHDSVMYESTGLYGKSTIRKVDMKTGKVTQMSKFADSIFAEGITMHSDGKIYALSWHERTAFRINPQTLEVEKEFSLPPQCKEGWGITSDGKNLLVSDSTQKLFTVDATDFHVINSVSIRDPHQNSIEVPYLNELEYIGNKVYANVYGLDHIAVIDPESGNVDQWIDCRGLWKGGTRGNNAVFNGIAFDESTKRLFVTGKNWSQLFEIDLINTNK